MISWSFSTMMMTLWIMRLLVLVQLLWLNTNLIIMSELLSWVLVLDFFNNPRNKSATFFWRFCLSASVKSLFLPRYYHFEVCHRLRFKRWTSIFLFIVHILLIFKILCLIRRFASWNYFPKLICRHIFVMVWLLNLWFFSLGEIARIDQWGFLINSLFNL